MSIPWYHNCVFCALECSASIAITSLNTLFSDFILEIAFLLCSTAWKQGSFPPFCIIALTRGHHRFGIRSRGGQVLVIYQRKQLSFRSVIAMNPLHICHITRWSYSFRSKANGKASRFYKGEVPTLALQDLDSTTEQALNQSRVSCDNIIQHHSWIL